MATRLNSDVHTTNAQHIALHAYSEADGDRGGAEDRRNKGKNSDEQHLAELAFSDAGCERLPWVGKVAAQKRAKEAPLSLAMLATAPAGPHADMPGLSTFISYVLHAGFTTAAKTLNAIPQDLFADVVCV